MPHGNKNILNIERKDKRIIKSLYNYLLINRDEQESCDIKLQ